MTKPTGPGASDGPPYLRIVASIRRRIEDGELVPGDRVPSTREIARDWGVALATATKALTTLRLEGLVEARPRIGTVVAATTPARPPRASSRPAPAAERELTLDRIVRTAVDMADAEGLAALSMRGVAARLGVAAMSPYRYVPSKEDLVLLMAEAAFGEQGYPADAPQEWRPRVELGARTLWALYRRHPWLAQLGSLTRPLLVPNLMVHGEWMLSALDGHGLDPVTLFDIHVLLYSHVQGLAVHLEWEAHAAASTGQTDDQWMDSRAPALRSLAESGRFPTFTKVVGSFGDGYDMQLDALFEFGLRALLDGLTSIVDAADGTGAAGTAKSGRR
ncbi:TetR/AcrR family transcriptional regulator C-terminal domain-containing protein [Streptomyces fructofermentans]|uniref:TetR/AcrR family transcriptional regulator C-terminal domain-containing protein n=1 Tax=Streptomyces fructofermentans TaxID=152141 RepID=UPI001675334D|nr:TetR/AcrR family transcriptional regulator C-terminal domain-containing protein [Streptomyces fructofermentans]